MSSIYDAWDNGDRPAIRRRFARRDELIRLVGEAGGFDATPEFLERFAALVAAAEREACAKVCEEKQEYSMPIACPDGISGCLVAHYVPARRDKTGSECAAAIRARGNA